jgi:imidazole glycerol-phosphate synthase subunit HisF
MNKTRYIRVIPKLDIKGPNLVKGIHLEGLRVLGRPEDFARFYYHTGADELIYIDLVASLYGRSNLVEIVKRIASEIFIPLSVGGGVRSLKDMHDLLRAGADKIIINTALFDNLELLEQGTATYGSQCMVVYIEAKKKSTSQDYECMHTNARENSGIEVLEWAKKVEEKGAGEIFLTFVDSEGTGEGLDYDFLELFSKSVNIPVIANGGFGNNHHIIRSLKKGADAVSCASIFHYHGLEKIETKSGREQEGNTAYIDLTRSGSRGFLKQKIKPESIAQVKNEMKDNSFFCRTAAPGELKFNYCVQKKKPKVVIVDYGMGNMFSLDRAFKAVGADVVVTSDPEEVKKAGHLILPGVGAFPQAVKNLQSKGLFTPLLDHAKKGSPLLGICLGMQLLFSSSDEIKYTEGLNILPGNLELLFKSKKNAALKLPHIGWNRLILKNETKTDTPWSNTIFLSVDPGSFVYFVHSFAVYDISSSFVLSVTDYGEEKFCSAVQKDNVSGCQFHPELSSEAGLNILNRFIKC